MPSLLLDNNSATFWLPEQASTFAPGHDWLFYFIYWLSVIAFAGCMGVMTYFAFKYRRRSKDQRTSPSEGNTKLEIFWSAVPALFFLVIFATGFKTYIDALVPPANATEIRVVGYKWFWEIRYANGQTKTNELVVPVNTPVRLVMSSEATSPQDPAVIHSFFIPAFRTKRDVLPYRYTVVWFEATQTGTFDLFCTEYCGTGHSKMIGSVRVVEQDEFEQAIQPAPWDESVETFAEFGQRTMVEAGCTACHSTDGSRVVGPSFKGIWGTTETMADGTTAEVDANYVRESIMDPMAGIVAGYPPSMPTFAGRLTDQQIDGLIEYIKSLQ